MIQAVTLTYDINLGSLLVAAAIGILTTLGTWGVRKLAKKIDTVLEQHDQAMDDIDEHAEVLNLHTDVLVEGGLVKGPIGIPRVEERRRKPRIYTGHTV